CETKRDTGALVGGTAGAVLGSEIGGTTGTLLGAAGGALLGREIGRRLDERDRANIAGALESGETGDSTAWPNPDTGASYEVSPAGRPAATGRSPAKQRTARRTAAPPRGFFKNPDPSPSPACGRGLDSVLPYPFRSAFHYPANCP